MIDMHCHILPGLDDGADGMGEALRMAEAAVRDGITAVIATPHHANGRFDNEASVVREAVRVLNDALREGGIALRVYPGQEVRIYGELLDDLQKGRVIPLHQSSYLLLELPPDRIPKESAELVHELQCSGITPIIAHPERNMEIARHPERLKQLIELGAFAQVTSHSVSGAFGGKTQSLALRLCRERLVQLVASDAHDPVRRSFGLGAAYSFLGKKLGTSFAEECKHNADRLLQGLPMAKPILDKPRSGKWYRFW